MGCVKAVAPREPPAFRSQFYAGSYSSQSWRARRGWDYDGAALESISNINFFAWIYSEARYGARVFAGAVNQQVYPSICAHSV